MYQQIDNPAGAYGDAQSLALGGGDYIAGATLTAGQVVALNAAGNVIVGTVALAPSCIGVTLDAATTGQSVRVATSGAVTSAVASAAIAAGAIVSPAAAGQLAAASATIGSNIGFAVTAAAGAASVFTLYVWKM